MRMRWNWWLLAVTLGALAVAVVLAVYALRIPARTPTQPPATFRSWQVTLCYPDFKASRLVRFSLTIAATSEERVVEELVGRLKAPETPDLSPALPSETRLLSVRREGNVLVLDLNDAFVNPEFWQGSDVAHLRLQALVHTLCSLPNTHAIRLLVNGQVPEALGGHEEVSEPIQPDPTL